MNESPNQAAPTTGVRWRDTMNMVLALAMVLIGFAILPTAAQAASSPGGASAAAWPASFDDYTHIDGSRIGDTNDDMNPPYLDMASGACSGCAGPDTSVALTSDGTNAFFRMRLAADLVDTSKGGLFGGTFLTQIAVGGAVKAVVGVDGKDSTTDYVYVANAVGATTTKIYTYPWDNTGGQNSQGLRFGPTNDGTGQYLLDFQVPISALTTISGGAVTGSTPIQLYYGSSAAANLATINKDFMLGSATAVDFSTLATVTLNPFTVAYDTNGGSANPTSQSVKYNQTTTAPTDPTRAGYAFTGWYSAASGGTKWNFGTGTVTANKTLYAQWAAERTVTFDAQGGDYTPAEQTVGTGLKATEPSPAPVRTNYLLKGWYTAPTGGTKWDFTTSTVAATDVTLYAQWFKASNTLTFDSMGGSPVAPQAVSTIGGPQHPVKPADPTKAGEQFYAWTTAPDSGSLYNFDLAYVSTDYTIYAFWDHKVTFDTVGGTTVDPVFFSPGRSPVAPANPTQTGYTFSRWALPGGSTYTFGSGSPIGSFALHAIWAVDSKITFDTDGGSAVADQYVSTGTRVTQPADPTRTGYTFDSWYTTPTGNIHYNFTNTVPTGDTTIYARWAINNYPLSFNTNGGSTAPATQTVAYDTTTTKPADPTRPLYSFTGWNTTADGTGTTWDFTTSTVKSATSLYAQWAHITHPVTFDSNGGSTPADQAVNEGDLVTKPSDPTRTGYTFDGWYTAPEIVPFAAPWDFSTDTVTSDTTLYGHWTQVTHTVTFYSLGRPVYSTETVIDGGLVTRPADAAAPAGYEFDGWYHYMDTTPWDFANDAVTGDTTIEAHFTALPVTYYVYFNANGGSTVPTNQQITTGDKATQPADGAAVRAGYTLTGWSVDPTAATPVLWNFASDLVTSDVHLYAVWAHNPVTITFVTDGGSAVDAVMLPWGTLVPKPADPTRAGYTFDGWLPFILARDYFFAFATQPANSNLTLTAQWTPIPTSVITFNTDGGSPTPTTQTVLNNGHATEPTAPTKPGYVFAGWDYFGGTWDFANYYTIYPNLALTAHWTPVTQNIHTVTFDANGGDYLSQPGYDDVPEGGLATEPVTNRIYYSLSGWSQDPAGMLPWNFATSTVTADTTLYAQWTPVTLTITFDTHGGSPVASQAIPVGSLVTKPASPTRPGYTFMRWFSAGSGLWEFDTYTTTIDRTIEAQWSAISYVVFFNGNGGTSPSPTAAYYDGTISAPTDPARAGYTFTGWNTAADGSGTPWDFTNDRIRSLTFLYAQWTQNAPLTFAVTFDANGGSTVSPETVNEGELVTEPVAPTLNGYTFIGWFTAAEGGSGWDFATDLVNTDTTIYARWSQNAPLTFAVTFDTDGASAVAGQTITTGETVVKPADPVRAGYTFDGWYTAATGGTAYDLTTPVTADTVLYARWAVAVVPPVTPVVPVATPVAPIPDPGVNRPGPVIAPADANKDLPDTGAPANLGTLGGLALTLLIAGAALLRRGAGWRHVRTR